ncbi:MAG: helix-turn-helix domain-containing protein [Pseudomonadota bacterium]
MPMNQKTDRLLTVAEVAERLGISPKTVRREIASGALESVRVGPAERLIRVSEKGLAVHLAARNT